MNIIRINRLNSLVVSLILLLIGFHSVPAFADNSVPPTDTNTTTTSPPSDQSTPALQPDPTTSSPSTDSSTTPPDSSSSTTTCPASPCDTSQTQTPPVNSSGTTTTPPDTTNTAIDNTLNSTAQSGNATVSDNGSAGNATSGDAQAIANLLNILSSSTSLRGDSLATFVQNINGNINGDLTIDPGALTQTENPLSANNTQVDTQFNGSINNYINLLAQSGNATVTDNGSAGNATTGSADAMANIVNIINSIIASNKSFFGVINIYGNLNGNILVPSQLANTLLTNNDSANLSNNIRVNNNQSINNQVTLSAQSGNATVSDNGSAGNATTGNATTNLSIFNLTGDQIIGSNAFLVFVNVLGSWVGLIMNAPAGTTSAILGGDISQSNIPSSTNQINSFTNEQINNIITASATTGNASVTNNGVAGNATTGNAKTDVNIINILGSQINLSNWFGVLFINVFGSWTGSLTIAPRIIVDNIFVQTVSSVTGGPSANAPQVLSFSRMLGSSTLEGTGTGQDQQVLSTTISKNTASTYNTPKNYGETSSNRGFSFIWKTLIIVGLLLFACERILTTYQKKKV